MRKFALFFILTFFALSPVPVAWAGVDIDSSGGSSVIFSGLSVLGLKSNLDLNGAAQVLTGTVDPSAVATTAQKGSLYLNTSSSNVYRKTDNGSSTNWTLFATGGQGGVNALLVDGYYAAQATNCNYTRSSTTLGPLNGGTLTSCPAFTVESPTTPPYTVSSSSATFPSITLASLPAGTYEVEVIINLTSTTAAQAFIGISDGTNTHGVHSYEELSSAALQKSIRASFQYGSSGSRTFTIYVATGTGSPAFSVNQQTAVSTSGPVRMTVKRWQ